MHDTCIFLVYVHACMHVCMCTICVYQTVYVQILAGCEVVIFETANTFANIHKLMLHFRFVVQLHII